jgi:predicted membrane protein
VIPLDVTASNVTVVLPENIPVEVQADMTFGNIHDAGNGMRSGRFDDVRNYNEDQAGAKMIVKIDGAASNVTIQEGN